MEMKEIDYWTSSSSEPYIIYTYKYVSSSTIFYGIHNIFVQYENNEPVEISAKFDTGAKSSSVDFSVAKKMGIPNDIIEKAKSILEQKIDKRMGKEETDMMLKNISESFDLEVETVNSASGKTIRAYIPVTLHYGGKSIKTKVNLTNREGLKAEGLVGLRDMI